MYKRWIAMMLIGILLITLPVVAAEGRANATDAGLPHKPNSYPAYVASLSMLPDARPDVTVNVDPLDFSGASGLETDSVQGREAVLLSEVGDTLAVDFTVEIPGWYSIGLTYLALPGNGSDVEITMTIDGEMLFSGMEKLTLTRLFAGETGAFTQDNRGNELRPAQAEVQMWQDAPIQDGEGIVGEPYAFYFSQGRHHLAIALHKEAVAFSQIRIYNEAILKSYQETLDETPIDPVYAPPVVIEAEHPQTVSSSMLYPVANRTDPNTTPSDPTLIRLNAIGGKNWVYPSQRISWEFEILETGYYALGTRYLQNFQRGMNTSREIRIDGEILFSEMKCQSFSYGVSWKKEFLGADEPYYFYLEKGKHTVEMSVTTGDMAALINAVDNCVYSLNEVYRQIIMVTGTVPDVYRDYYLDTMIPGLMDQIKRIADSLKSTEAQFIEQVGRLGSEAAILNQVHYQLDGFLKAPNTIPSRLSTFQTNISALAAWVLSIRQQPLQLDKIYFVGYGQEIPQDEYGFWDGLWFAIQSFCNSFITDYSSVGNVYDKNAAVSVWINAGRDQAEVLKGMIDQRFSGKTGILVNFSVVQGNLMQAVMAGKGPDVALMVGRGQPINMALRDALIPLNDFEGFDQVRASYGPTDLVPYTLNNQCYGLAETKNFYMMFYRTDIFGKLGIKPPETWDELYGVAEVLQRNNMNIGLPYVNMDAYAVVNQGLGSQSIFPTLLLQNGVRFYSDKLDKTNLSTETSYKTFKTWVEFYSLYGFPIIKDDYNRFRTGELPLTITNYTFYNQLYVAAPEIRNLWEMMPIPATVSPDGTLNRNMVGSGTACVMIRSAKNRENAWKFMQWWTDAESQGQYGREIEMILGAAGRYNPAKAEAISQIPWSGNELEVLVSQLANVQELEEIPGGYYASRNMDNAFKEVVYGNKNPRETLNYWNDKTDEEIIRKREEFGIE